MMPLMGSKAAARGPGLGPHSRSHPATRAPCRRRRRGRCQPQAAAGPPLRRMKSRVDALTVHHHAGCWTAPCESCGLRPQCPSPLGRSRALLGTVKAAWQRQRQPPAACASHDAARRRRPAGGSRAGVWHASQPSAQRDRRPDRAPQGSHQGYRRICTTAAFATQSRRQVHCPCIVRQRLEQQATADEQHRVGPGGSGRPALLGSEGWEGTVRCCRHSCTRMLCTAPELLL